MRAVPRSFSRRRVLGLGAGAAAAASLVGCDKGNPSIVGERAKVSDKGAASGPPDASSSPSAAPSARPIGDGSTSFTGKQPHQPAAPEPLDPGQTPPQFVIFSWDGAGEVGNGLFPRFLDLAK